MFADFLKATMVWPGVTLAVCLTGCAESPKTVGPETTTTSGVVTLDKTPLANGQIVFVDVQGSPPLTYGGPIVNGKYKVSLTPGTKRVEISARQAPDGPTSDPGANLKELVPSRYNSASTLTADIGKSSKGKNFDLLTEDAPQQ